MKPERFGFGTTLIDRMISGLGGAMEREWLQSGIHIHVKLPLPPIDTGTDGKPGKPVTPTSI